MSRRAENDAMLQNHCRPGNGVALTPLTLMRICPRCTLLSPDIAIRCDCGYSFQASQPGSTQAELRESKRLARHQAKRGLLIVVWGIFAGSVANQFAGRVGHALVLFGSLIVGMPIIWRAVVRFLDLRRAER